MLGMLKRTLTITLDFDWFYRGFGKVLAQEFDMRSARAWGTMVEKLYGAVVRFVGTLYRHHGPHGVLARTWPTGSMAIWTSILLGAYLVLYYFA